MAIIKSTSQKNKDEQSNDEVLDALNNYEKALDAMAEALDNQVRKILKDPDLEEK